MRSIFARLQSHTLPHVLPLEQQLYQLPPIQISQKQAQRILLSLRLKILIILILLLLSNMAAWLSLTSNWLKKQYFNGAHYLDILANRGDAGNNISLFGITFDQSHKEDAVALYRSVLWFTYRQGLAFEGFPQVTSDVGWGCMIRVGQMLLAQVLRIHAGQGLYQNEKYLEILLQQFIQPQGRFSIETISQVGNKKLQKSPGEWYSPFDIAIVIKQLIGQKTGKKEKSKLSTSFEVLVFNGEISLTEVLSQARVDRSDKQSTKIKPCLVIVLVRIGYDKPEPELLESVVQMVSTEPNCVGILGGRPNKAHYIFGSTDQSFIYLDPHCVKNQTTIESFLCDTIFSMGHEKIDPSLGICFYFPNFTELTLTHERLRASYKNSPIYCCGHDSLLLFEIEEEEVFQLLQ